MKRSAPLARRTPLRAQAPQPQRTSDTTSRHSTRTGDRAARSARERRRLERLREEAAKRPLSEWERTFIGEGPDGLAPRLERYGRAFGRAELADPADPQAPLSLRQGQKVREIGRSLARRPGRGPR